MSETFPNESSNSTDKDYDHHSTLRIGVNINKVVIKLLRRFHQCNVYPSANIHCDISIHYNMRNRISASAIDARAYYDNFTEKKV